MAFDDFGTVHNKMSIVVGARVKCRPLLDFVSIELRRLVRDEEAQDAVQEQEHGGNSVDHDQLWRGPEHGEGDAYWDDQNKVRAAPKESEHIPYSHER